MDKAHTIRRQGDTIFFGETEKEIETMIQHREYRLLTEPHAAETLIQ